jgi:ergothioneine biosynthesis protein EgtB
MEFIDDGGYADARWWLSDGFASARTQGWDAPLYWRREGPLWLQMTLYGERAVEPESPVAHVSFFEADAFARWSKKRLPTEFEWEQAAIAQTIPAPATAPARFRPRTAAEDVQRPLRQLFGDVWEWTASPYLAYPGFVAETGAIGEYNGKFMCGQFVLRGGSCATPAGHIRSSYRNFFYPGQRWQFSGLRLAEDRS